MTADYKRITFAGSQPGWVGAKAGAYNALVGGVDSINIDDDAYFFYDTAEAEEALIALTNQGLVGKNIDRPATIVDIVNFTFTTATPTNTRWIVIVNGTFWVGRKGGAFYTTAGFGQCTFFHTKEQCLEAQDILTKQGLLTTEDSIFVFPLALIVF